jgi:hypothetical protein
MNFSEKSSKNNNVQMYLVTEDEAGVAVVADVVDGSVVFSPP